MNKAWFLNNWMCAGFVAGLFLLAVLPVFAGALSFPLLLVSTASADTSTGQWRADVRR